MFDGLDDYEADLGRCQDCALHRALFSAECSGCQFRPAPPIAGQSDREFDSRLEAQRVTLQFAAKSSRRLDSGRLPMAESPLFGGPAQKELF